MDKITWKLDKFRLSDLTDYAKNPRSLTEAQFKQLKKSLDKFGMIDKPIINADAAHTVIGGHQRLHVLRADGVQSCECWIPDRELDAKEVEELNIRLNKNTGEWDFDALANGFETQDLLDWGFDAKELGFGDDTENNYSRNIQAPIYTPKGEKPAVGDLFDDVKAKSLIAEIDATDLPEDEKEFLRIAARRHTVLNYKRIAEFYAHSDEKTQALMENSALVIIDFGRAIELGYVKLSQEIAKQYLEDYPDAG